jgi:hypothetical protein
MESKETIAPRATHRREQNPPSSVPSIKDENPVNILGYHRKSEARMIQYLDLNFKEDARPFVKETPKDPGDFRFIKESINVASGFGFLAAAYSAKVALGAWFLPTALFVSIYIGALAQDFWRSYKNHKAKEKDFQENGDKDYADMLAKALIAKADEASTRLSTYQKYPDLRSVDIESDFQN